MMNHNMAHQAILSCLNLADIQTDVDPLAQFSASDWDYIVQQADQLGIASLLYHRLQQGGRSAAIPMGIMQTLRRKYLATAVANMSLYRALHHVLIALRNESIPTIVLKGAWLAENVYRNIALRPMADVDFLVRQTDLSRTLTIMRTLGYVPLQSVDQASHHHVSCCLPETGALMEVHWDIRLPTHPVEIDVESLWERAEPSRVAGVEVSALSLVDALLHLCFHAAFHHVFNRNALMYLVDIAEFIQQRQSCLDWQEFTVRAQQWGINNAAFLTLSFANELAAAHVPEAVLEGLSPEKMNASLFTFARRRIFALVDDTIAPWSDNAGRWRASHGLWNKLSVLRTSFWPSTTELSHIYTVPENSKRLYLYYFVRWKDILTRHLPHAWQVLHRDQGTKHWMDREAERTELLRWMVSTRDP